MSRHVHNVRATRKALLHGARNGIGPFRPRPKPAKRTDLNLPEKEKEIKPEEDKKS